MTKHIDRFSKEEFDNSKSSVRVKSYNLEIKDVDGNVLISKEVNDLPRYSNIDELKLWIIEQLPITVSASAILEEKQNG